MRPIKYKISIQFESAEIIKYDIELLKNYLGDSLSEISSVIKENHRIELGELVNEKFYSGIREMLILLRSLRSRYCLYSNGGAIGLEFLDVIAAKLDNLKLEDIR